MNEDKEKEIREEFKVFNGDQVGDEIIANFWLNKMQESNKALLTKLRGEIEIKRRKLNPLDRSDDFSRNIAFNQAKNEDIALIDKYLE